MLRFAAVAVLWATPAFAQPTNSIEGRWFGAMRMDSGDRHCWLSDRRSNGTYLTDFMTEDSGMFERYNEGGRWAQSSTAFVTLVETRNGVSVSPRRLEYTIIELSASRLTYRHVPSGTEFTTLRVGMDFQLPQNCGMT